MSQIKVYFDNYEGNYGPNDTIEGRVHCYFESPKTVRGIKVRIYGAEHTSWMDSESYYDSHSKRTKTRLVRFTGDHTFYAVEIFLFGSDHGNHEMGRGEYNYRFSTKLPSHLPGSYECTEGHIRYLVKAIVDRPFKFDIENEVNFFVVSPINFNLMSRELQEPGHWADEKQICCCCCKSGPIELEVSLQKRAFVPGERIVLDVRVTNLSNVSVDAVNAKLKQEIDYYVKHPSSRNRSDNTTIAKTTAPGIGAHGEHEFQMNLDIPEYTSVPNFTRCTLFKVSYILQVECELPGCHVDLDITILPQLGNIPYGEAVYSSRGPSANYYNGVHPPPPEPVLGAVGSGYPGMPMPAVYPPTLPLYPTDSANPPPYPPLAPNAVKGVFPGGPPTAPSAGADGFEVIGGPSSGVAGGSTSYSDAKAKEAGFGGGPPSAPTDPSAPTAPSAPGGELPPPSYDELSKK